MARELITIEENSAQVQQALERLARRTGDITPAFKVMSETLSLSTDRRFSAQVAPDGRKWAPLKRSTLRRKKNTLILTESTKLRDGIHGEVEGRDTLLFGSDSPYGAVHQLGGEIGLLRADRRYSKKGHYAKSGARTVGYKVKMPARPFLGVSDQDARDLLEDVEHYLSE